MFKTQPLVFIGFQVVSAGFSHAAGLLAFPLDPLPSQMSASYERRWCKPGRQKPAFGNRRPGWWVWATKTASGRNWYNLCILKINDPIKCSYYGTPENTVSQKWKVIFPSSIFREGYLQILRIRICESSHFVRFQGYVDPKSGTGISGPLESLPAILGAWFFCSVVQSQFEEILDMWLFPKMVVPSNHGFSY